MNRRGTYPVPAQLCLYFLGAFQSTWDGMPLLPPRTRKAVSLLVLLMLHAGGLLDRTFIAGTLWPESTGEAGSENLRQTLAILRRTLGPASDCLLTPRRHQIGLDVSDVYCDVLAFDTLCARWERIQDDSIAKEAMSLYRGPLLIDSAEDWLLPEREKRRERFFNLLRGWVENTLASGNAADAHVGAKRWVDEEPLSWQAQQLYYRTIAATGDTVSIGRAFRDYRLLLRSEGLGEPDPEMSSQVKNLVVATPTTPATASPPASIAPTSFRRLPTYLTPFLGREEEASKIRNLLTSPCHRLVTLRGPGGVGKTRLAVEILHKSEGDVAFIDLAALPRDAPAEMIWQSIATVFEVAFSGEQEISATVKNRIATARMRLLLDNAEHLIAALAEVVANLLECCPHIHLLLTSREPIGVAGESVVTIPPLPESDAANLFLDRLLRVREVNGTRSSSIHRICRQLDCLPLALELAAGRGLVLSLEQIETGLHEQARLLKQPGQGNARHQSISSVLNWSWETLSTDERTQLTLLGVFSGGWTTDAAGALLFPESGDSWATLEALENLCHRSWVVVMEGRFTFLETTRQYITEHTSREVRSDAQARHSQYFLRFLSYIPGEDDTQAFYRFTGEWSNIRASLRVAPPDTGLSMAARLGEYFLVRGLFREGREAYSRYLAAAAATHPARGLALYEAGRLAQAEDDIPEAKRLFEEGFLVSQKNEDFPLQVNLLGNLGLIARNERRLDDAEALYSRAFVLGHTHDLAAPLDSIFIRAGILAQDRGKTEVARLHLEEAVRRMSSRDRENDSCVALTVLGFLERNTGNLPMAISYLTRALPMHRALGYQAEIARTAKALGECLAQIGCFSDAAVLLKESRNAYEGLGGTQGLNDLGETGDILATSWYVTA